MSKAKRSGVLRAAPTTYGIQNAGEPAHLKCAGSPASFYDRRRYLRCCCKSGTAAPRCAPSARIKRAGAGDCVCRGNKGAHCPKTNLNGQSVQPPAAPARFAPSPFGEGARRCLTSAAHSLRIRKRQPSLCGALPFRRPRSRNRA